MIHFIREEVQPEQHVGLDKIWWMKGSTM